MYNNSDTLPFHLACLMRKDFADTKAFYNTNSLLSL